jgi:hypothetical protein
LADAGADRTLLARGATFAIGAARVSGVAHSGIYESGAIGDDEINCAPLPAKGFF